MSFPERENDFFSIPKPKHRYGGSEGLELVFGEKDERNLNLLDETFIGAAIVVGAAGVYVQIRAINSFFAVRKKVREAGFIPPRMPKPIPFNGLFHEAELEDWPLPRFDEFAQQYGYDNYPTMKKAAEERDMKVEDLAWGILRERGVI